MFAQLLPTGMLQLVSRIEVELTFMPVRKRPGGGGLLVLGSANVDEVS
jgi:hypothetical protein